MATANNSSDAANEQVFPANAGNADSYLPVMGNVPRTDSLKTDMEKMV